MPARVILLIRWLALIVLVLAVVLIIARWKLPMPQTRSESLLATLRRALAGLRKRRADVRAHENDLAALQGRRALLVDPDEKSARVMAWKLENLRCAVVRTRTGMQALSLARTRNFDFVVVDALLPDMSAAEFYRSLGSNDRPVVFVGVLASQHEELRSLSDNVACLSKPYDPEEAAAIAGYILSRGETS